MIWWNRLDAFDALMLLKWSFDAILWSEVIDLMVWSDGLDAFDALMLLKWGFEVIEVIDLMVWSDGLDAFDALMLLKWGFEVIEVIRCDDDLGLNEVCERLYWVSLWWSSEGDR